MSLETPVITGVADLFAWKSRRGFFVTFLAFAVSIAVEKFLGLFVGIG
jgi:hypothetical protein